jgi:hypothetical protein
VIHCSPTLHSVIASVLLDHGRGLSSPITSPLPSRRRAPLPNKGPIIGLCGLGFLNPQRIAKLDSATCCVYRASQRPRRRTEPFSALSRENYRALRPATLCGLSVGRLVSDDGRSGRCGALWSPLARNLGSGGHPRGRKPVLRARGGKTAPPLDSPQECRLSECQGTEASEARGMPHCVRLNGDTTTRKPRS